MGVLHDHLKRSVPERLYDSTQIHSGHNKSTGKGMAVAMPAIGFDLGVFERGWKPAAPTLAGFATAERRKDRSGTVPL